MSHITKLDLRIESEPSLAGAVKELGGTLVKNCKTFDAYSKGQPCLHKIVLPGVNYQIGVRMEQDGSMSLHADFYSNGGNHDGNKLQERFGSGLSKLKQMYAVHQASITARKKGYTVQRNTKQDGTVRLVMTGM